VERPVPVDLRCRGIHVDRRALRALIRHCLDQEGLAGGLGCGLVLAGDRLVRRLNREWRGRDAATDVLSFPMGETDPLPAGQSEPDALLAGEVVISLRRCLEQARERAAPPGEELARLVIHGVLHVLGHDHQFAPERRRMRARERKYAEWMQSRISWQRLLRTEDAAGR